MRMRTVFWIIIGLSSNALSQPADMEVTSLFGECKRIYSAAENSLILHLSPDLNSATVVVPYNTGWLIPYRKPDGLTRVLEKGQVQTTARGICYREMSQEGITVDSGQRFTYLYYLGEGFGRVEVAGVECELDITDATVIKTPDVQAWIRVLFADGTSPGWLLNDGSQTMSEGIQC